jgi:hypothetical protein
MGKIILEGEIIADGRLEVKLPPDLPPGKVEVEIREPQTEDTEIKGVTLGELLDSGLAGIWADRTDIPDTLEFARLLRMSAWSYIQEQRKKDDSSPL